MMQGILPLPQPKKKTRWRSVWKEHSYPPLPVPPPPPPHTVKILAISCYTGPQKIYFVYLKWFFSISLFFPESRPFFPYHSLRPFYLDFLDREGVCKFYLFIFSRRHPQFIFRENAKSDIKANWKSDVF